jgi:hypothetical protein
MPSTNLTTAFKPTRPSLKQPESEKPVKVASSASACFLSALSTASPNAVFACTTGTV